MQGRQARAAGSRSRTWWFASACAFLAWCSRCPKAKSFLFDGRYDERTLKPVNNAIKDYARHLNITEWVIPQDAPEYTEETGICLGDGTSRDVGLPPMA